MTPNPPDPVRLTVRGSDGNVLVADRWIPEGRAPVGTLLFLHGGGQTRHSWARTARRTAVDGWQAITVDARGHGDSDWVADGGYTLDAFSGDLRSIIDALNDPPVVIGASLGGSTALVTEGEHPGTCAALVLVDIVPKVEPEGRARIIEFMASAPDGFGSLEEVADAVSAYNPHRPRPRNLDGLRKNVRRRADGRWYWHWDPRFLQFGDEPTRNADGFRLYDAARNLRVPTLLVRGAQSDVVTAQGAAEMLDLVPGAQVVEVEAGHMVAGDDNDVFTTHLTSFLAPIAQSLPRG